MKIQITTDPFFEEFPEFDNWNDLLEIAQKIQDFTKDQGLDRLDVTIKIENGLSKTLVYYLEDEKPIHTFTNCIIRECEKHLS